MASERIFEFPTPAMYPTEANFAPIEEVDGANIDLLAAAFDDTTEEYRNFSFMVPGDADTGGTITFGAYVFPKTAPGATANVELRFGHSGRADNEDWDGSYTNEDSGDISLNATASQDYLQYHTWTETFSNLGWAVNDLVFCRLSRIEPSASDLTGDLYVVSFRIVIPV